MPTTLRLVSLSALLSIGCGGQFSDTVQSTGSTGDATTTTDETGSETAGPEVGSPTLRDLDAFQVVAIPLLDDGIEVAVDDRPAPLVAGREVVMRAKVDVPEGWMPRDVELRIEVSQGSDTTTFSTSSQLAMSSGDDANSGLVVELPALAVTPEARYSASLWLAGQTQPAARFPDAGEVLLAAETTGPIKLHIVPFEVDGRVPDTSAEVIDEFAETVYAYYPTTDVEITVGPVQPNPYPDLPIEEVLGTALFDVGVLMEQELAPADVYYYGLMQPTETREQYNGVTGSSQELDQRAGFAIGAGFGDALSASTLVHELGHLHYLKHAPCGSPDNVDPDFPHPDGMAHTEGYDSRTNTFLNHDAGSDLMSYCQPRWISGYHYEKLASWVQVSQTW